MKDLDVIPQKGFAERCIDDLDPGTSGNDRQSLSKVTNKEDSDATKEPITIFQSIQEVLESTVDGFWAITMLHRSFIPYDDFCPAKDLMHGVILRNSASGSIIDGDGDFEA
jgi:hypothetical protein